MAITVNVENWTGGSAGSPTKSNGTTYRFRTDDSPETISVTNPIHIPPSGFNYSYFVHVALELTGTFTLFDNMRFYSDGTIGWTFGTGGEIRRGNRDTGDDGCPVASYFVATGTPDDTGDELGVTHTYFSAQTVKTASVASDTSGSPATIDSGSHTTAESTKAVVLQLKVADDATNGAQSAETFTFIYDVIN